MNNALAPVRWERYSPVGIGLEDMFKRLDAFADNGTSYPPYNIVRIDEHSQELQIALAGFKKEDIEVAVERGVLQVSVSKSPNTDAEYIHKGIAQRTFSRNWQLSEDTKVHEVSYADGLLKVVLVQEVPEEMKRKLLPIT